MCPSLEKAADIWAGSSVRVCLQEMNVSPCRVSVCVSVQMMGIVIHPCLQSQCVLYDSICRNGV